MKVECCDWPTTYGSSRTGLRQAIEQRISYALVYGLRPSRSTMLELAVQGLHLITRGRRGPSIARRAKTTAESLREDIVVGYGDECLPYEFRSRLADRGHREAARVASAGRKVCGLKRTELVADHLESTR